MRILRYIAIIGSMLVAAFSPWAAYADHQVTRMSDKSQVGFARMIEDVRSANVIFIGETHTDKMHHEVQLDILRALQKSGIRLAIGLEMFSVESQQQLDQWVEGRIDERDFEKIYMVNWSENWLLYRNIFLLARNNHIPMIALNIPKQIVYKVAERGFGSLRPEEKKGLPSDITCVLNTAYTEFLRRIYAHHPENERAFTYFCEAQTLRNNGMAWNIAKYAEKHPKRTVVVLAGALHAVKNGIPEQMSTYRNLRYKVILPELPGFSAEDASPKDADFFFSR